MSQSFKKQLLKEACERTSRPIEKAASSEVSFTKLLTAEAEYRIRNIKEASLYKQAMAVNTSRQLMNSVSNTVWTIPDKTSRIKKIEQELVQAFRPYTRHILQKLRGTSGRQGEVPLQGYFGEGITLSEEDQNSTLRMEFEYRREVFPTTEEARNSAERNVDLLEQVVPGFRAFTDAVNEHKITLMSGYATHLGTNRPDHRELKKFILAESQREGELQTAAGPVPLKSFWKVHKKRYDANGKEPLPKVSGADTANRLFGMDEAFTIAYPSYLLRAVQARIFQGFRLDPARLHRAIAGHVSRVIAKSNASQRSRKQNKSIYYYVLKHWVKQQEDKIINAYELALQQPKQTTTKMKMNRFKNGKWVPSEIDVYMADFGQSPTSGQKMRGFRTNAPLENSGKSKNLFCLDLNTSELQYLLYSLTDLQEGELQRERLSGMAENGKEMLQIPENGFYVPAHSLSYMSNGFDTDPFHNVPGYYGAQLPVIPPITRVPKNMRDQFPTGVAYNTDHGNLCRGTLVGRDANTNVTAFLTDPRVGPWAIEALKILREPGIPPRNIREMKNNPLGKNVKLLFDHRDTEGAYEVWRKYIGTTNDANRTGAETLQEFILSNPQTGQQRSLEDLSQFLTTSIASQNNLQKVQSQAEKLLRQKANVLRTFRDGERLVSFLQSVAQNPANWDEEMANQLFESVRAEANLTSLDAPVSRGGQLKPSRKYQDALKDVLTKGGREAQSKDYTGITDEMYEALQNYGYPVAKMMDFLHALMARSCQEMLVRKLSPDEAIKKRRARKAALQDVAPEAINDTDDEVAIKKPSDQDVRLFTYGRTYAPTTGKNQKGTIVFGIKYAFNPPEFNPQDPAFNEVYQQIYRNAREKTRARGHGEGLRAPQKGMDPGMGRQTANPQQGREREEVFQPTGKQGVMRLVEDMTFWFGSKSSEKGRAKTHRGTRREVGFTMEIEETYSYEDALAELRRHYSQIESDLDIVFSPISVNVNDMKRAADKAVAIMKQELEAAGINIEIAITDSYNQTRLASTMEEIGAAAALERMEQETDDNAANRQVGYTHDYETETAPEAAQTPTPGAPGQTAVAPAQQTGVQPTEEPAVDMDADVLEPQPQQPPQTPPPTPPEEEPRQMPKPMEYIGKPKKKRPLIRNGPDPQTSKLRHSSTDDALLKLADRLDRQGQSEVANKLDVLLAILREE